MLPALATIIAAYVAFRMLEVFCLARERYSSSGAGDAARVLAVLVLLVTGVMMWSIYGAELATTRTLQAERSAAAALTQALDAARQADPAPPPAPAKKRPPQSYPQHSTGWVERVIDGDTFVLNSGERIRIFGIDAPELKNEGGGASRDFLLALIDGRVVKLERRGKDRYGRTLADVFLLSDGKSVGRMLLDAKLAAPYLGEKVSP